MDKLKGSQKKILRSQAHHLKPLVIIGAKGLTSQLIGSVDLALKDHELIKVKFGEFKEKKGNLRPDRPSNKKRTYRPHRQRRHFLSPATRAGKKKN